MSEKIIDVSTSYYFIAYKTKILLKFFELFIRKRFNIRRTIRQTIPLTPFSYSIICYTISFAYGKKRHRSYHLFQFLSIRSINSLCFFNSALRRTAFFIICNFPTYWTLVLCSALIIMLFPMKILYLFFWMSFCVILLIIGSIAPFKIICIVIRLVFINMINFFKFFWAGILNKSYRYKPMNTCNFSLSVFI